MTLSIARADEPLMALGVAGVNHNLSADDYGKRVLLVIRGWMDPNASGECNVEIGLDEHECERLMDMLARAPELADRARRNGKPGHWCIFSTDGGEPVVQVAPDEHTPVAMAPADG